MTNIDQFESAFESAAKAVYHHRPIKIGRVLVVTDLSEEGAEELTGQVRDFLSVLRSDQPRWTSLPGRRFYSVKELLIRINEAEPDLIVTYRHLHSDAWRFPYSLGEFLDVISQATHKPVLVLPHPQSDHALPHTLRDTNRVMAMTDHLAGDDRLVQYASRFTAKGGTCWLTHLEDQSVFDRYIEEIGRIPAIDTDLARELIGHQLLKEPADYIDRCRRVLERQGVDIRIEKIVQMGQHLDEYERLITKHGVDLLVMNTKDQDQMAMHGLAYPLAVQLRQIPLLML